ncbi:uncharacterized protein LOC117590802 [Drosophila guanche]|uniref:Uncharacterized protein n=1 Tax=Drosophila guanche TaxID=7266 RepID=A0A3B0K4K4_DROGU|nr:uncharacterized protein LOC117590802 [Drosophila guanche]SPP89134.1 Hypothetical predicted protein [Drosophila guanche]
MCSNLVDLFGCIKPQAEAESETMPETLDSMGNSHRRSMQVDDMVGYDLAEQMDQEMLREEQQQQQQRLSFGSLSKRLLRAPRPNLPPSKHLPAATCIRPPAREKRNSFETLERYEQVFSAPTGSERYIPDQF